MSALIQKGPVGITPAPIPYLMASCSDAGPLATFSVQPYSR